VPNEGVYSVKETGRQVEAEQNGLEMVAGVMWQVWWAFLDRPGPKMSVADAVVSKWLG
jgi:hypothetical protein